MDTQALIIFALVGVLLPMLACAATVIAVWWGVKPNVGTLPRSPFSTELYAVGAQVRGCSERCDGHATLLRRAVPALVMAITVVVAQHYAVGNLAFPPVDALGALPVCAALGIALGLLVCLVPPLWMGSKQTRIVSISLIIAAVVLPGLVTLPRPYSWLPTAIPHIVLAWLGLRVLLSAPNAVVAFLPTGVWLACMAATLVATGSLRLGQVIGSVAFAMLGLCIAGLVRPMAGLGEVSLLTAVALAGGALAQAVTFGETPQRAGILLCGVAPIGVAWIVSYLYKSRERPVAASLLACGWIVLVFGGFLAWYLHSTSQSSTP
jgi:hypothetical protein